MCSLCESPFYSIQGEGPLMGTPSTFIRFSDCSLRCQFCFGIKPGRRIPRLITPNGNKIKLSEAKIGDKLLTYNDNIELVETEISNIISRDVTEWYEIKIENKMYFVTPEHPFFTSRGLIKAEELIAGDQILHSSPNDKLSYHLKTNNPMKNPEISKKVSQTFEVQSIKKIDIKENRYFGKSYGPKPLHVINLSCAPYNTYLIDYMWVHNCDTKHSWDTKNKPIDLKAVEDLVSYVCEGPDSVVITGGEPLMNYKDELFLFLLDEILESEKDITIETTFLLDKTNILNKNLEDNFMSVYKSFGIKLMSNIKFMISPKFDVRSYSGMTLNHQNILDFYTPNGKFFQDLEKNQIFFKPIYKAEWEEIILKFLSNYTRDMIKERFYIMPYTPIPYKEDSYKDSCMKTIDFCVKYDLRYSPRIQIDVWGNRVGV
jgi:organic radical activating enzyme